MNRTPPKYEGDIRKWAELLQEYLAGQANVAQRTQPQAVLLAAKVPSRPTSAAVDGVLMFDPVLGTVVVSVAGVWREVVLV